MADVAGATAETVSEPTAPEKQPSIEFRGSQSNLVPGSAMLIAAALAFSMGMTDVFFAEATAWTFVIWDILLIYTGLIDMNEVFEVREDALVIRNVMRPWGATRVWAWENISRFDVVVKRPEARPDDIEVQIYHTSPGEIALNREDRAFDPELAALVIERAGLHPSDASNPKDLHHIPSGKKVSYTWS